MTAVQRTLRAINRDVDVHVAACAEHDLLLARLVYWTIADDPRVCGEQFAIRLDDLAEMGRTGFLFAFEKELDVGSQRDVFRFESSEGVENRHHTGFVVGSGTRVDAPLGIERCAFRWCGYDRAVCFQRCRTKHWLPRLCAGPLFGIGRLAVVMRVEQQRALGAGSFHSGVNSGRRVWRWSFEQTR